MSFKAIQENLINSVSAADKQGLQEVVQQRQQLEKALDGIAR